MFRQKEVRLRKKDCKYGLMVTSLMCTVKCKAIPVQAWTGPEGSRRMRLPDFKAIGT